MATINPTGMGYRTSHQFNRVANDILKFANSVYEYNELNPVDNQWYNSHGTMRTGAVKYTLYPTHVSTLSPSIMGPISRKTSQ